MKNSLFDVFGGYGLNGQNHQPHQIQPCHVEKIQEQVQLANKIFFRFRKKIPLLYQLERVQQNKSQGRCQQEDDHKQ